MNEQPGNQQEGPDGRVTVPCEICGSSRRGELFVGRDRLLGLPGQFPVQRCQECGFIYTSPRPSDAALVQYYPQDYGVYSLEAGRASRVGMYQDRIARQLDRLVRGSDRRVLDVGCGDGLFLSLMAERGWTAHGLEMDSGAAGRAAARGGMEITVGTAEGAQFAPETFHLITLSHVLEHLPHPREALRKVREWLREDGVLFITVPNAGSWERRIFGEYWYHWDIPRHLLHFSPVSLHRLLREEGFAAAQTGFLTGLFVPQSIRYMRQDRKHGAEQQGGQAVRKEETSPEQAQAGSLLKVKDRVKTLVFKLMLWIGERAGRFIQGEIMEITAVKATRS
ncbi:MAG: class I SAM-dependent methyltransferase [Armatimonadota bacterium]|nr:class I SAM-dependent methyltransferase [Armatimonadota bacterium]